MAQYRAGSAQPSPPQSTPHISNDFAVGLAVEATHKDMRDMLSLRAGRSDVAQDVVEVNDPDHDDTAG